MVNMRKTYPRATRDFLMEVIEISPAFPPSFLWPAITEKKPVTSFTTVFFHRHAQQLASYNESEQPPTP
jgi:hypothetical protein